MELKQIEQWYNVFQKLNQTTVPVLSLNGRRLTPDQIMIHARANDETWQELEAKYPDLNDSEDVVDWDLLVERIEEKNRRGLVKPLLTMGKQWTPDQIMEAVRKRTLDGISFLIAEKRFINELRKKCTSCDEKLNG